MYRTLLKNIPDSSVLMFDKENRYLVSEGAALKAFGSTITELEGKAVTDILEGESVDLLIHCYQEALKGKEFVFEREVDSFIYRVKILPLQEEKNREISSGLMITQDITEFRHMQKELEIRLEELERSNENLEQFAYVASHDLQEPLRKIRAFGDRLQDKYSDKLEETGVDYINRMKNAAERMQVLINDLLSYARISTGGHNFELVDLNNIIEGVIANLETGNSKIIISKLPIIEGHSGQLRSLFQNLLGNALKFSTIDNERSEIEVSAERVKRKNLPELLKSRNKGKYTMIQVKDNGIGFDEKYLDKIFSIFQRLHGKGEFNGTGIGLAICQKIIDNHYGYITAKSKLGEGATFIIYIPYKHKDYNHLN